MRSRMGFYTIAAAKEFCDKLMKDHPESKPEIHNDYWNGYPYVSWEK
jgi:hypothetical protein